MADVSVDLLRIYSSAIALGENRSRSVVDRATCWEAAATSVFGRELLGDGRLGLPVGF